MEGLRHYCLSDIIGMQSKVIKSKDIFINSFTCSLANFKEDRCGDFLCLFHRELRYESCREVLKVDNSPWWKTSRPSVGTLLQCGWEQLALELIIDLVNQHLNVEGG